MFLLLAFVLSVCSIGYQLLLTDVIISLTGNKYLWEAMCIGAFIGGMAVGAMVFYKQPAGRARRILRGELLLVLCGSLSVCLIKVGHMYYRSYFYLGSMGMETAGFHAVILFGVICLPLVFAIGYFTGFELPYLLSKEEYREEMVLAVYYFGALGGTLAYLYLLRPFLIAEQISVVLAACNMAALIYISWRENFRYRQSASLGFAALALALLAGPTLAEVHLKHFFHNRSEWTFGGDGISTYKRAASPTEFWQLAENYKKVQSTQTPYQRLDLVTTPTGDRKMFLDRRFQVSTSSAARYHSTMAGPAQSIVQDQLKNALIIGGGDGMLAYHLLSDPQLEHLKLVELDKEVLAVARRGFIHPGAKRMFADQRADVKVGDGLAYLRQTTELYDAVFIDLNYPLDFDFTRFYSVEFLRLAARAVAEHGVIVIGTPLSYEEAKRWGWLANFQATTNAAGLPFRGWVSNGTDHFLIMAKQPIAAKSPARDWQILIEQKRVLGPISSVFYPVAAYIPDSFF